MLELQHKKFIIESYFRTGRNLDNVEWVYSINQCLQDFRQGFPNLPITYAQLLSHVHACIDKFQETGAVTRKPGGGAPKKRTAACIEDIRQRMDNSPKKSIPKLSQQVQLSVGTCHTILKKDLELYPYKIQAVHELTQLDFVVSRSVNIVQVRSSGEEGKRKMPEEAFKLEQYLEDLENRNKCASSLST
ncbi:transposable element tc3 transposase-like protein [Holotrichia oblita]|uniref:Transposable element tc3 transposase-like protein n=1 Tax=Holotrichia oblita TaxID=644536 RepID=A0ACB9SXC7_HOLOL|nr:transposable element tc3 transposase-like protein [Holotrichia oblita]